MSIYNKKNMYAHINAYYAVNLDSFDMKPHSHDQCEIMYVTHGTCQVDIDDTTVDLKPNDFVFIDQGVPHRLQVSDSIGCTLLNIEFQCSSITSRTNLTHLKEANTDFDYFLEKQSPFLTLHDHQNVGYSIKDLIANLESDANADSYLSFLLFSRMLIEISSACSSEHRSTGIKYIRHAVTYITEHLFEPLNVQLVADAVGVNRSYLQTLFSNQFGYGIVAYINRRRMEKASFLLINSTISITDIAFQVGYNSRQHFGHTFNKFFGMHPKKYRLLNAKDLEPTTGLSQVVLDSYRSSEAFRLK